MVDGTPRGFNFPLPCGNAVSPPPLCAVARANLDRVAAPERLAA